MRKLWVVESESDLGDWEPVDCGMLWTEDDAEETRRDLQSDLGGEFRVRAYVPGDER